MPREPYQNPLIMTKQKSDKLLAPKPYGHDAQGIIRELRHIKEEEGVFPRSVPLLQGVIGIII